MPTTEIISIGSLAGPYTSKLKSIRHRCDSRLSSDRDLFQDVLDRLVGTIVHLGYPTDESDDGFYFLGGDFYVDSSESEELWGYKESVFTDIVSLMYAMRDQSPTNHVVFLTDYQFGPEERRIETVESIDSFVKLNQDRGLRFNTLYSIGCKLEECDYWDYYEISRPNKEADPGGSA